MTKRVYFLRKAGNSRSATMRNILKSLIIMSLLSGGVAAILNCDGSTTDTPPSITKVNDVLMTYSGLTVVSYGGYLNGESFQQDGILTFNGYQYTCFWNTGRRVILARRALPEGAWSKIEISSYTNNTDDAHNTISLGICPNDGTLHIAFDHHSSPLHYIKSVPNLITRPDEVAWATASFGQVTNTLDGRTPVSSVTYPRFITTPQGDLLFEYRYGTSGSGDQYLYQYSGQSQSWSLMGKYIDGITASTNAYPHGIAYESNSQRLHLAWCWRNTSNASTNHDLLYVYSDDNGYTWKNNAGQTVAQTGVKALATDTSGIVVWKIGQNRGLINQEHMAVDFAGNVHVLLSHMPDYFANDADFTSARSKSLYFHYWRNTDGTWSRNALNIPVIANFRGKIAVTADNNLYAVLPDLRIASASRTQNWSNWAIVNRDDAGRFFSDPLIDTRRLKDENVLTVYYPQKGSANIYTLDYEFGQTAPPSGSSSGCR